MPSIEEVAKVSTYPDIGYCHLKPGYEGIIDPFTIDLERHGLEVVHGGMLTLPPRVIDYMYRDSRGEFFYETMAMMLGERAVYAMFIDRPQQDLAIPDTTLTVQGILESLKRGANGYPNLRDKYMGPEYPISEDEYRMWLDTRSTDPDPDITFSVTQGNVFHASDGTRDAWNTLLRMRDSSDPDTSSFFDDADDPRVDYLVDQLDRTLWNNYCRDSMTDVSREWRVVEQPPVTDDEAPIRQVYVWIITSDEEVVIVSKDGEHWQMPGGKPNNGEDVIATANREVHEETGLDISGNDLRFFGEYTIIDPSPDTHPKYRQVRAWIRLNVSAGNLELSVAGEDSLAGYEVRFVKTVPVSEIASYIPWMPESEEYRALRRNRIIDPDVVDLTDRDKIVRI